MDNQPKKRGHTDPQFMEKMRQAAAVKRAEQKKLKDAERLKAQKERETKLKEADDLLNPKPEKTVVPPAEGDSETESVAPPKKTNTKQPSYKELYYMKKLELLDRQSQPAPVEQPKPQQPLPYNLAVHRFKEDVNKSLMDNMYKHYFKTDTSPYQ